MSPRTSALRVAAVSPAPNSQSPNVHNVSTALHAMVLESPQRPSISTNSSLTTNTPTISSTPGTSNGVLVNSHVREMSNGSVSSETPPRLLIDVNRETTPQSRSDPQVQRTRRSSRNLDESSRRRSSRTTRQPTSQNPQNSVRNATIPIRPTLDLPPGYGIFN